MQILLSAAEMQQCDRSAIETYGIPGLVLMELAGRAVVDALESELGDLRGKRIAVCCGKGNNGGDGFVAARHLLNRGALVDLLLLARRQDVRGDARVNLDAVLRMMRGTGRALRVATIASARGLRRFARPDGIVDAIFGTGFDGTATGIHGRTIEWINAQGTCVVSADIPSGVHASTGEVKGAAVHARRTVAMGAAKTGQYIGAGVEHCGKVTVAEISIPAFVLSGPGRATFRVEARDVQDSLPQRSRTAHKYSVGKLLVIAGSRQFTGAAALCAMGALKSGAGAVVLAVPEGIRTVLARKLTEVILLGLPETPDGTLGTAAHEALKERSLWADAVALGPGLGRNTETDALILDLIGGIARPLVVDADALNALATRIRIIVRRRHPAILTPHTGELARLTGKESGQLDRLRIDAARDAARSFRCCVVLKGAPTVTASPAGRVVVNSTGNPGMATIGTGDVLTGVVAGLLAQGMEPHAAAVAGVFLHGRAGDLAAAKLGMRSMLASDLLTFLPDTFRSLSQ